MVLRPLQDFLPFKNVSPQQILLVLDQPASFITMSLNASHLTISSSPLKYQIPVLLPMNISILMCKFLELELGHKLPSTGCFLHNSLGGQVRTLPRTGHASYTAVIIHHQVNSLLRNRFLRISCAQHPTVYLGAGLVHTLSGGFQLIMLTAVMQCSEDHTLKRSNCTIRTTRGNSFLPPTGLQEAT